jgi:hypothetical protein
MMKSVTALDPTLPATSAAVPLALDHAVDSEVASMEMLFSSEIHSMYCRRSTP